MRVLQVNTRHKFGGGDSTYAFAVGKQLRDKGHEVAYFAMKGKDNLPDPNEDLFVSEIDFKALNGRKSLATAWRTATRAIYSKEARGKFRMLLERFHPDVVHLHNIHAHITPSILYETSIRKIPVVWTLHDYKLVCPNSHFLVDSSGTVCEACGDGNFYHAAMKRCKKGSLAASLLAAIEAYVHRQLRISEKVYQLLCPSQFLLRKMIEGGLPASRLRHLPYLLDDAAFNDFAGMEGGCSGYGLFLGKVERLKGVHILCEACRLAPNVRVVLAGRLDEGFRNEFERIRPPNVEYVGLQKPEGLKELLVGALFTVLPSIWYENQPFAILEGFAAGIPAVASDLGGMAELVGRDERGLLVPAGDAPALAAAMQKMSSDTAFCYEAGMQALSYAKAQHSVSVHYDRLMDAYQAAQKAA